MPDCVECSTTSLAWLSNSTVSSCALTFASLALDGTLVFAYMSGEVPRASTAEGFAPSSCRRHLTTSAACAWAAKCSAVRPSKSTLSTGMAPSCTRRRSSLHRISSGPLPAAAAWSRPRPGTDAEERRTDSGFIGAWTPLTVPVVIQSCTAWKWFSFKFFSSTKLNRNFVAFTSSALMPCSSSRWRMVCCSEATASTTACWLALASLSSALSCCTSCDSCVTCSDSALLCKASFCSTPGTSAGSMLRKTLAQARGQGTCQTALCSAERGRCPHRQTQLQKYSDVLVHTFCESTQRWLCERLAVGA